MIAIAAARTELQSLSRHPRALTLSAALHGLVVAAWLFAPVPSPHDLGAGALTVQLLVEPAKPEPEPPAPEPPKPSPQPQPEAKPLPVKPMAVPKAATAPRPAAPSPSPVPAAAAPEPAAQPVMTSEPATAIAESAPPATAVAMGTPNARSAERDDYLRMVWSRIMRHRPERVPFAGTTRLRFTLAVDGELLSVEVAESSGSGMLDRAALEAVRRAAPFPPPPPLSAEALQFEIPFQFR